MVEGHSRPTEGTDQIAAEMYAKGSWSLPGRLQLLADKSNRLSEFYVKLTTQITPAANEKTRAPNGVWRLVVATPQALLFKSLGCGSFRTGDSGAVERKMDLSYYGSGEGILGLGSWVGQNNLTRKTDRLDFWIFLLHPLQVRARGAAHRDQLAVRVARGMVSERLLPLVKAPIGVEVSAGLQRTQA